MLRITMQMNVGLCVFNFLPLLPLDGHHIVREMLPDRMRKPFMRWQVRFGPMVLLLLVFGPYLLYVVSGGKAYFSPVDSVVRYAVHYSTRLMAF